MMYKRILAVLSFFFYGITVIVLSIPWFVLFGWSSYWAYQTIYWIKNGKKNDFGIRHTMRHRYDDEDNTPCNFWCFAPFRLFDSIRDWANDPSKRYIKKIEKIREKEIALRKEEVAREQKIAPYMKELDEEYPGVKV